MKEKGRAGVYAVAGIYFFYLAYTMFQNREASVGNEHMLVMVFSVIFVLAGIVILFMAYRIMKHIKEEESKAIDQGEEHSIYADSVIEEQNQEAQSEEHDAVDTEENSK